MRVRASILVLLLASATAAQQASYTYTDQQPPYKNPAGTWTPLLTALDLPKLGSTFRVQVPFSIYRCCPFQQDYFLATGTTNPNAIVPSFNGFLYTSADVAVVTTPTGSGGFTSVSFSIPNSPALIGVHFYQQVLVWSRNSYWTTLELSRGGHGVIGY